ncbi:hypothetical protein AUEXF2481DRAFT_40171 [Aureobasidium subglaciale EXF-2481]|uniref:Uncharacterized protein n=1 Tax=Aureobasidium subglaciale (strain EXF-2481) TaxID=1043005 RepID=A0A074YFU5_AURSE|nr:uncharacterized protein AUEXF2481DRAFT_40171 [Aureobasidium subglaciale EXF-2481]KEQ94934.1 hypothetical protein AUEXF2481DRAFT_40171 [Aureobasidium subglaciale EXF-2481]
MLTSVLAALSNFSTSSSKKLQSKKIGGVTRLPLSDSDGDSSRPKSIDSSACMRPLLVKVSLGASIILPCHRYKKPPYYDRKSQSSVSVISLKDHECLDLST